MPKHDKDPMVGGRCNDRGAMKFLAAGLFWFGGPPNLLDNCQIKFNMRSSLMLTFLICVFEGIGFTVSLYASKELNAMLTILTSC
jgi:hypothetical protein